MNEQKAKELLVEVENVSFSNYRWRLTVYIEGGEKHILYGQNKEKGEIGSMNKRKVEGLENKAIKCIVNGKHQEAVDALNEIIRMKLVQETQGFLIED